MKLIARLTPLALVVSAAACVSGGGRGPSATPAADSSRDAPADSTASEAPPAGGEPSSATTPVDPPRPQTALTSVPARPPVAARPASAPYRVRVVSGSMQALPVFHHQGRTYVLGTIGERYAITVSNPTARRVEAVISVDGLDAIDGTAADYAHKRGYILPAHESLTIEGFRTSLDQVATFRFSSVADSYAGRLGQARDVGVIGVAFFPERPAPPPPVAPAPVPYASRADDREGPAEQAPSAPRAEGAPSAANAESSSGRDLGGAAPSPARKAEARRGLGTEFGEARESRVTEIPFVRADETSPSAVVTVRYDDRAGLLALGIPVDPPSWIDADLRTRETADPFRANRFAAPPPPR